MPLPGQVIVRPVEQGRRVPRRTLELLQDVRSQVDGLRERLDEEGVLAHARNAEVAAGRARRQHQVVERQPASAGYPHLPGDNATRRRCVRFSGSAACSMAAPPSETPAPRFGKAHSERIGEPDA